MRGSFIFLGGVCLAFVACASASVAAPVAAEAVPGTLPVDTAQKNNAIAVGNDLREGKLTDPKLFDDFFLKYELPRMTSPALRGEAGNTNKSEPDLPAYRKKFRSNYFGSAKAGPSRERLNQLVLDFATKKIVPGDFDPAVKYNALLMVADLNEDETKPYQKALVPLVNLVRDKNTKNDYLKVAALIGLQRHAEYYAAHGAPANIQNGIVTIMSNLLAEKQAPDGRTASGHAWLRASAAKVLGSLGAPGTNGVAVKTLVEVIGEDAAPPSLRLTAAECLGQIKFPPNTNVDVKPYVRTIGKLAVDTIQNELDRRESRVESGSTTTSTDDDLATRRKLKAAIRSINTALTGERGRAGTGVAGIGGQDKGLKQLIDVLRAMDASIDKNETGIVEELAAQLPKLQEVLQTAFGLPKVDTDKAIVAQ
jgi:hypothetical protein